MRVVRSVLNDVDVFLQNLSSRERCFEFCFFRVRSSRYVRKRGSFRRQRNESRSLLSKAEANTSVPFLDTYSPMALLDYDYHWAYEYVYVWPWQMGRLLIRNFLIGELAGGAIASLTCVGTGAQRFLWDSLAATCTQGTRSHV